MTRPTWLAESDTPQSRSVQRDEPNPSPGQIGHLTLGSCLLDSGRHLTMQVRTGRRSGVTRGALSSNGDQATMRAGVGEWLLRLAPGAEPL